MNTKRNDLNRLYNKILLKGKFAISIFLGCVLLIFIYLLVSEYLTGLEVGVILFILAIVVFCFIVKYCKHLHCIKVNNQQSPKIQGKEAHVTWRRKNVAVWVVVFLLVFILILDSIMTRYIYSTSMFYIKWVQCGHRPVATRSSYGQGRYYYHTKSLIHSSPLLEGSGDFFCTSYEAESAGYFRQTD